MATVNKNFKVKNGLVVEGSTATVAGNNILTETAGDSYILNLVGGAAYITSVKADDFTVTGGELTIAAGSDLARIGDITDALFGYATETYVTTALGDYTTTSQLDTTVSGYGYLKSADLSGYATESYVTTALGDYTTTVNLDSTVAGYGYLKNADLPTMYSDADVDAHLSGGNGIDYTSGTIAVRLGSGLEIDGANQVSINRSTVDGWYDASGAASTVQGNLEDHASDTGTHGVTEIVGASETQTLSNKTFTGGTNIGVDGSVITDTAGDLEVKAQQILTLKSRNSDIILDASGSAYYGSASAENELATHGYVDNAISGLNWKSAVNLLAHTSIALTGDATSTSIDGHSLASANGYRVLLTGQTTDSENGIYDVDVTSGTYTFTRAADADTYQELIGAAVYVMEGTTYGSTSWVQSDHYLTDFTSQEWTQFSGQGSVTAGTGIVVDGLEVSVDFTVVAEVQDLTDGLALKQDTLTAGDGINIAGATVSVDPYDFIGQTNDANYIDLGIKNGDIGIDKATLTNYTNTLYDAIGAAATAESNANDYTDTAVSTKADAANPTITGSLTLDGTGDFTITSDANIVLDANTTSYIGSALAANEIATKGYVDAEIAGVDIDFSGKAGAYIDWNAGSNQYDVNITDIITDGDIATNTSVTTAINALTTSDIEEGTNLYFTDQKAIDAIQNTTPWFTSVGVNNLAEQVAATISVATASTVTAYSWNKFDYRTAKFLVKTSYGNHTEVSEVLLTLDVLDNIAITEYATIGTNGSAMTISADVSGNDVRLRVTTVNNTSDVYVYGTLLA